MVFFFSSEIDRQGPLFFWYQVQQEGAYLTIFPREMMQSMTGFPTKGRFFNLARAASDPPTTGLCKKLFLAIDEWHDRLAVKELSPGNNNPIQPIVAANAFVQPTCHSKGSAAN
ncbi:hypothetical protein [Absidia glauca]|uniref:Ndc10 domain-containing protein n=1 Tax=Absidia glauca TaxID=4829 RepID=A0A163MVB9_ABSGL|nr:hypothetical protein [Absidia glauca]